MLCTFTRLSPLSVSPLLVMSLLSHCGVAGGQVGVRGTGGQVRVRGTGGQVAIGVEGRGCVVVASS